MPPRAPTYIFPLHRSKESCSCKLRNTASTLKRWLPSKKRALKSSERYEALEIKCVRFWKTAKHLKNGHIQHNRGSEKWNGCGTHCSSTRESEPNSFSDKSYSNLSVSCGYYSETTFCVSETAIHGSSIESQHSDFGITSLVMLVTSSCCCTLRVWVLSTT